MFIMRLAIGNSTGKRYLDLSAEFAELDTDASSVSGFCRSFCGLAELWKFDPPQNYYDKISEASTECASLSLLTNIFRAIILCMLSRFVASSCQSMSCDCVEAIAVQRSAEVGFASVTFSLPNLR